MRIAVPTIGETISSNINENLGRSPFIAIYDSEIQEYSFFINPGFQLKDGSGLKAAEILVNNNTDILLTKEVGRKAYSLLMKEHIDIHLLNSTSTVKSAINKFLKKRGK